MCFHQLPIIFISHLSSSASHHYHFSPVFKELFITFVFMCCHHLTITVIDTYICITSWRYQLSFGWLTSLVCLWSSSKMGQSWRQQASLRNTNRHAVWLRCCSAFLTLRSSTCESTCIQHEWISTQQTYIQKPWTKILPNKHATKNMNRNLLNKTYIEIPCRKVYWENIYPNKMTECL